MSSRTSHVSASDARAARNSDGSSDSGAARSIEPPSLDKRPQATSYRVEDLLQFVSDGRIRVPEFQRSWQWSADDVTNLFDSLYRGYPVGTLLLWKRKSDATILRLGPHEIDVPAREDALWVVDGQQRITALAGVLLRIDEAADVPDFELYFDLSTSTFTRPSRHKPPAKDWLPMRAVVDAEDLFAWLDEYRKGEAPRERVQLAIRLGKLIREYEIPAYLVDTQEEKVLRHVFHRVNRAGKPLKEADVFDALHGVAGQSEPGDLGEVAERLQSTKFGTFDTDLLLTTLRSLLGRDVATDYEHLLPEGTQAGEVLGRTERALRHVIAFFREDARIPHLRLVPYTMPIVALAVFFDRHPHPSSRSRQLLARWIWRGAITGAHQGNTISLREAVSSAQTEKETAAVAELLRALPERPAAEAPMENFNFRMARSKLEVLALLALEPQNLMDFRPITVSELFDEVRRDILPYVVHARPESTPALKARAMTVANRLVHPPVALRNIKNPAAGPLPEDILRSHAITPAMLKKLRIRDSLGFLKDRTKILEAHIASFLESRAAWSHSDRPALKSLLIEDD